MKNILKLLEENNLEKFKVEFSKSTFNNHHRELMAEVAFKNQNLEIFKFLETKVSLSKDKMLDFFVGAVTNKKPIEFNSIEILEDILLAKKINKVVGQLVKYQNDNFLNSFVEKFPISVFTNLNRFLFYSFKENKDDFLKNILEKKLPKESILYVALCALKFNKKEMFAFSLTNSIKEDPGIMDDIQSFKDKYILMLRNKGKNEEKDEISSFIDESLILAFNGFLESELSKKSEEEIKPKKKIKI